MRVFIEGQSGPKWFLRPLCCELAELVALAVPGEETSADIMHLPQDFIWDSPLRNYRVSACKIMDSMDREVLEERAQ